VGCSLQQVKQGRGRGRGRRVRFRATENANSRATAGYEWRDTNPRCPSSAQPGTAYQQAACMHAGATTHLRWLPSLGAPAPQPTAVRWAAGTAWLAAFQAGGQGGGRAGRASRRARQSATLPMGRLNTSMELPHTKSKGRARQAPPPAGHATRGSLRLAAPAGGREEGASSRGGSRTK